MGRRSGGGGRIEAAGWCSTRDCRGKKRRRGGGGRKGGRRGGCGWVGMRLVRFGDFRPGAEGEWRLRLGVGDKGAERRREGGIEEWTVYRRIDQRQHHCAQHCPTADTQTDTASQTDHPASHTHTRNFTHLLYPRLQHRTPNTNTRHTTLGPYRSGFYYALRRNS